MIFRWLKNGCRQTPSQIASLLTKTIRQGVKLK
jgi:hypothetical protein